MPDSMQIRIHFIAVYNDGLVLLDADGRIQSLSDDDLYFQHQRSFTNAVSLSDRLWSAIIDHRTSIDLYAL